MPRTSRNTSAPQSRPAESVDARLTDQTLTAQGAEGLRLADALHESEERFRSLFENTIYGILLTGPDGSILAANAEACRLLRMTEPEICAAGPTGVFDSNDHAWQTMLQDGSATGEVRGEATVIRGDGSRFPVEFSSAIITDGQGSLHTSLAFRDISERKRAEDAVAAVNRQLEALVVAHARQVSTLLRTGRDMASELQLQPLLANILSELRAAIEYTGAAVASVESSAAGARAPAWRLF